MYDVNWTTDKWYYKIQSVLIWNIFSTTFVATKSYLIWPDKELISSRFSRFPLNKGTALFVFKLLNLMEVAQYLVILSTVVCTSTNVYLKCTAFLSINSCVVRLYSSTNGNSCLDMKWCNRKQTRRGPGKGITKGLV